MIKILNGDCREVLKTLPDCSVQCCVTSPPYWGLRDYGTAKWEGGDVECEHTIGSGDNDNLKPYVTRPERNGIKRQYCQKCGAVRVDAQLGLEPTPDEYVANLVAVFREVRRILREEGTLWLNLGDSYCSMKSRYNQKAQSLNGGKPQDNVFRGNKTDLYHHRELGLKDKDLIGIPWRVAFALQADGWWLRQDIIWCLSGGTRVYARTQKGEMPTTIKDIARLDPATVQLWNGEKWTQLLGMSQSSRNADELEMTLRSGEKIACTPTHKFPTERGLLTADELRPGDRLIRTTLPPPSAPLDSHHMTDDAAWFAGLYLAEGSRSGHTLQIAGHVKESERWERVQAIAAAYGGSATRTIDGNRMDIRVYGKMLHALVDTLVSGTNAKTKHLNPRCWQYSNHFLHALLQGYLSGDGHYDPKNARWRLGFTRNDALAADMRTLAARLDAHLVLNQSHATLAGKRFPIYRGELRFERSGHWNQKHTEEIVSIGKARCRVVYDLGVEDEPHLFALASGILTHNSKPNPMPESVRDRCTKAHEYIFLLTKSARYYYDAEAVKEDASEPDRKRGDAIGHTQRTLAGRPITEIATQTSTRNRRSVWTVTTKPYREAHFATFPPALIQPCIRAGCPAGGTVLDPFGGSGTTGEVAASEGRKAILIELNPEYVKLAKNRGGLFYTSNDKGED